MKKINIFLLTLLFIVGCIFMYGYYIAPRYQPFVSTGTLTLDKVAEMGLHIQDMSMEKGLTGWYEKGEYIIYFGSKRTEINPWIERTLAEAPKFSVDTVFSDNSGLEFLVRGGGASDGSSVELPYGKKVSKIDQSEINFELVLEAIGILKQAKIDSNLDYEYDAIVRDEQFIKDGAW